MMFSDIIVGEHFIPPQTFIPDFELLEWWLCQSLTPFLSLLLSIKTADLTRNYSKEEDRLCH